ncbi:uncharacterized protein MONOS_6920 [Monocercomonoides exilis]|uniref:uncharacterized protein n=1 Tax=Monocercomonoides exilis TaxID=2049356 RepID=UPI00355A9AD7|nr:hypothetical protein MONOS_6920 [Monocercomonoides exilis]|eukprot:MONOS_6920.1-p1 / transcript=MONOS_6920.1 / gene=MONOS_6920 / organism=Monocercomonoides_exilis_PA203 / gene_product=unspecified product / transcript_product=unspecified product / location=Mono_scaffold00227:18266-19264(-) / protein_length=314 / sequence_SO=supercontig / SO=protein_coding / is_pseudo=false
MIAEEEKKKEGKSMKLLTDLYECYLLLSNQFDSELTLICVSCLLKVASNKDKNEETKEEVEMALLALRRIDTFHKIDEELYLNEIKEIILHHQEHRNLTQLAYHYAWEFLFYRTFHERSLVLVIANELHFVGEAVRELEELMKCVDWKREKEEDREKEKKEKIVKLRWLRIMEFFFFSCHLWNDEYSELVCCIVRMFRSAKYNNRKYSMKCIDLLKAASEKRAVKIGGLLKGGADDAVLEGIRQPTMDYEMAYDCLRFFMNVSGRLKSKDDETDEAKRKGLKRKVVEKMEKEGFEDVVVSFLEIFDFLRQKYF